MNQKTMLAAMGVSLACGVLIGALGYAKFFALKLVQAQNKVNGGAYLQGVEGRAELKKACVTAVTGIVHPLVGTARQLEVVCPDPT